MRWSVCDKSGMAVTICALALSLLWSTPVHSESGITVTEIVPADATNPPPHQERVSNYTITIENTNDVCDEEITIANIGDMVNDFLDVDLGEAARGKAELLGFWDGANYVNPISYTIEDETSVNQIIGIRSGEDENGCDFRGFRIKVQLCDIGLKCWDCCDAFDIAPCEDPTPYQKTLQVSAQPLPPPPKDIGRIWGKVKRNNHPALAHISIRRPNLKAFCLKNEVDYDPNFGDGTWERDTEGGLANALDFGSYSEEGLPLGDFEVKARVDGNVSAPVIVTLTKDQPTAEVNFSF